MRWPGRARPPEDPERRPLVKIPFDLAVDDEGWPPVRGERVWARDLGRNLYRLDNTPWFVRGVSCYDVVEARAGSPGELPLVRHVVEHGGHLTLRVVPLGAGDRRSRLLATRDALRPLGVSAEVDQDHGILAVGVPGNVDLASLKRRLDQGTADGLWEYEEGNVSDRWLDL